MTDPSSTLILASSSKYRRELLERLGLHFAVISPEVDETPMVSESGAGVAERLARLKATSVSALHPEAVVIGSDQVAECRGRLLGKPGSEARAMEQLRSMRDAEVIFHTAVAVARGERIVSARVPTRVRLRQLSDDQLSRYLAREKPFDCAGSFKSERGGIALLECVSSDDPTALVGLPLIATIQLLAHFGLELP